MTKHTVNLTQEKQFKITTIYCKRMEQLMCYLDYVLSTIHV
uniref:Uncharacterized protein n=1 Tax=Arundo donax TaxID=35708 RepID=A0A0A9FYQ8_ARUDO